jgi:hypothetical protein
MSGEVHLDRDGAAIWVIDHADRQIVKVVVYI